MKFAALLTALVLALSAGAVEAKPLHAPPVRGNPCVQEIIRAAQLEGLRPGLKLYGQCGGR